MRGLYWGDAPAGARPPRSPGGAGASLGARPPRSPEVRGTRLARGPCTSSRRRRLARFEPGAAAPRGVEGGGDPGAGVAPAGRQSHPPALSRAGALLGRCACRRWAPAPAPEVGRPEARAPLAACGWRGPSRVQRRLGASRAAGSGSWGRPCGAAVPPTRPLSCGGSIGAMRLPALGPRAPRRSGFGPAAPQIGPLLRAPCRPGLLRAGAGPPVDGPAPPAHARRSLPTAPGGQAPNGVRTRREARRPRATEHG